MALAIPQRWFLTPRSQPPESALAMPSFLTSAARRSCPWLLALLLIPTPGATAEPDPEAYNQHLQAARMALAQGHFQQAAEEFEGARKAHGGDTLVCAHGLSQAYRQLGSFDLALASTEAMLALSTNPQTQAAAYNEKGLTLLRRAQGQDVASAAAAFQRALELSGGSVNAIRFNLGQALLQLERDEEGVAMLQAYLQADPQAPAAAQARALIAEPRRARENLVPDFSLTTLDGQTLSRESLEGKVVLLDFWATWCAPCRQAIPDLRRMERRLAKKGNFVLVSISVDRDPELVRRFVAENDMSWPQHVDAAGQLSSGVFHVSSFPTYVLIDTKGAILFRQSGWSSLIERQITSLASKAFKETESPELRRSGRESQP